MNKDPKIKTQKLESLKRMTSTMREILTSINSEKCPHGQPQKEKMSFQDVENVQTDKTNNRKVLVIAGAVAVVVILMAACGAVYFNSQGVKTENPPLASASASATGPVPASVPEPETAPDIYSRGDVFVVGKDRQEHVFLFNTELKAEVPLSVSDRFPYTAQVSPDGKFIGVLYQTGRVSSIRLADRYGEFLKGFRLPEWTDHFRFSSDSKRIIYIVSGRLIRSVDLNGENPQTLLERTSDPSVLDELIEFPAVLLENGALIYSIKVRFNWNSKVCMKKGGAEEFCWDNKFVNVLTIIPFGQFVYCVEVGGKIWKIDTSDSSSRIELKSFTVSCSSHLRDAFISGNGEFLYLSTAEEYSKHVERPVFISKVNIANAFLTGTSQLGPPIHFFSAGDMVFALVPTLREA